MLSTPFLDLHEARAAILLGHTDAATQMRQCCEIARAHCCANTFRQLNPLAVELASQTDPTLPLAGLAISVKDMFDVAN